MTDQDSTETTIPPTRVVVKPNGPIIIMGPVTLERPDGTVFHSGHNVKLCRCGGSGIKPFCDATHKTNGFTAP